MLAHNLIGSIIVTVTYLPCAVRNGQHAEIVSVPTCFALGDHGSQPSMVFLRVTDVRGRCGRVPYSADPRCRRAG